MYLSHNVGRQPEVAQFFIIFLDIPKEVDS